MSCIHSYGSIACFSAPSSASLTRRRSSLSPKPRILCALGGSVAEPQVTSVAEPLLLNAVRGEDVERPPVWLMRQAGRYMKSYMDLCERHPSFRERSENVDLVVEISLQPWKVFKPDGVILFSDILTPLSGMNIPFDIVKGKGPVIFNPLSSAADVDEVREFVPPESVPYVGEALTILRKEVDNKAAVLGFVGAPFTLASYVVEGGSSKHFSKIKRLAFSQPKVLHALLQKFATSMTKYIQYQADCGAQAVQIFDSWATELSPVDFEEFSLPYLKQIVDAVKLTHPDLPLILYASGSGGLLERLALTGVDVVSLDWSVDMAEGRKRLGPDVAVQESSELVPETRAIRVEALVGMEKRGKLFMEKRGKVLLGKYEVDRYLGQGTFAKVYRARNIETNKIVAIKAISRVKVEKEGLVAQTEREITIMRMLKHPNIVQLYDVMNTKDKICLVMEYAKGGELFHKIARGKLDEEVARNYFQQLITTVDFCHKNGVYHRDLKPENFLLDEKGALKVSDFGLSALADSKREDGLLHTSCGTPSYLAPEVLSKKAYDGAKADIWSCGVILYTLLAGQVPFRDRSTILMCRKICEADYSCPRWFPDEVRSLLSKILNPDPDKRILISEIVETYWFRKGSKSITTRTEVEEPGLLGASAGFDDGNNSEQQELARPTSSNRFDIITLSSNLDLSGLIKIFMVRVASVCSSKFQATLS